METERPCYYVKDRGKRVLIPGCWGTVHSGDMRDCYCDRPSTDDRLTKLEKQVAEILLATHSETKGGGG